MINKVHIKKDDTVYILSGKDKGKKGKVLQVIPDKSMVLVEGVNMRTKHRKPRSAYQQGGIIHQESPINSAKAMFFCNNCGTPSKVGKKITDNGEKLRFCKHCGETIDTIRKAK